MEFYQKTCRLDYVLGDVNLGVAYANGEGIRRDLDKALGLFGKACDLKSELECQNYAKLKK